MIDCRTKTLLPDCPTCAGTTRVGCTDACSNTESHSWFRHSCPDCLDTPGKVSVKQLVEWWNDSDRQVKS